MAEGGASGQAAEQNSAHRLVFFADHAEAQEEAAECVLLVIAGVRLVDHALQVLCKLAEGGNEAGVGIAVTILPEREPRELDGFLTLVDCKALRVKRVLQERFLILDNLKQVLQPLFAEEVSRHRDRQRHRLVLCGVACLLQSVQNPLDDLIVHAVSKGKHRILAQGKEPDLVGAARNTAVADIHLSKLADLLRQCLALALFNIESNIHDVTSCFSPLAAV